MPPPPFLDFERFPTEAQEFLILAQGAAGLGFWIWDAGSGEGLQWSRGMYGIFGLDPEKKVPDLSQVVAQCIHPLDQARVEAANQAVLQQGKPGTMEYRIIRPDGQIRWVRAIPAKADRDAQGHVVRLPGLVLDITQDRENRQRWEYALEGGEDGVWEWDLSGPEIQVQVSDTWKSLLGYPPEKEISRREHLTELIHPEDLPGSRKELERTLSGHQEYFRSSQRLLCADGEYRWFLSRGRVLEWDPQGRAMNIFGTLTDIHSLMIEKNFLAEACVMGSLGGWRLDPKSGQVSLTEEALKILDLPFKISYPLGRIFKMFDSKARRKLWDSYRGGPGSKGLMELLVDLTTEAGETRHLLIHAQGSGGGPGVSGLHGVIQDLTKKQALERAFKATEDRYRLILESCPDNITITDIMGTILLVSPAGKQMFCPGKPQVDLRGRNLKDFIHPEDLEKAVGAFRALKNGEAVGSGELRCVRDTGEEFWAEVNGRILLDAQGLPTQVVLVLRDITDRKHFLETSQRAERLDALTLLTSGLAHDFNNLLSGVFGFLQLAQASVDSTSKAHQFLSKALGVFEKAQGLTRQLLNFSKGGPLQISLLQINPLVQESVNFALSGSAVRAEFDLAPDLVPCGGDSIQLSQVFDNLAINAGQAMPQGGVLRVSTRNGAQEGQDGLWITFQDNGPGIPPEHLGRIFDPFFTTKSQGNGLGLATCYNIMEKHHGTISVESTPGQGTRFSLWLPGAGLPKPGSQTTAPATGVGSKPSPGLGSQRILILDDEPFILDIITEMVRSQGFGAHGVLTPGSLMESFEQSLQAGPGVFAVFIDLSLPAGDSGTDLARKIKQREPLVPLVAMTGQAEDPVFQDPQAAGFFTALKKPFTGESLAQVLGALARVQGSSGGV